MASGRTSTAGVSTTRSAAGCRSPSMCNVFARSIRPLPAKENVVSNPPPPPPPPVSPPLPARCGAQPRSAAYDPAPTVAGRRADRHGRRAGPSNLKIFAAEAVGTAVLMIVGPGTAILALDMIGRLGVAFAFGFALLAMAYTIGHVSGCHINPAVTLGFLISRKITLVQAVLLLGRPAGRRDPRRIDHLHHLGCRRQRQDRRLRRQRLGRRHRQRLRARRGDRRRDHLHGAAGLRRAVDDDEGLPGRASAASPPG